VATNFTVNLTFPSDAIVQEAEWSAATAESLERFIHILRILAEEALQLEKTGTKFTNQYGAVSQMLTLNSVQAYQV
jgi:hypothetical protein